MIRAATLTVVLALGLTTPLEAQDESGALAAAEAAYLEVDFEGTRDQAMRALRSGEYGPAELVRVYQLLGIASSALGDEDAARDYFVRMLGLDRNAELDDSVPPRLRNPFLEARGIWTARQGELGVEIGIDRAASALRVSMTDPADMARRIRIHARLEGATQFTTQEYQAMTAMNATLAGADTADRVEYFVEILDMHGNVIHQTGTEFEPRVVGRTDFGNGGGGGGGGGGSFLEEPVFWIVVGAILLVAGGITIGVVVDERSRIGAQTTIAFGI